MIKDTKTNKEGKTMVTVLQRKTADIRSIENTIQKIERRIDESFKANGAFPFTFPNGEQVLIKQIFANLGVVYYWKANTVDFTTKHERKEVGQNTIKLICIAFVKHSQREGGQDDG